MKFPREMYTKTGWQVLAVVDLNGKKILATAMSYPYMVIPKESAPKNIPNAVDQYCFHRKDGEDFVIPVHHLGQPRMHRTDGPGIPFAISMWLLEKEQCEEAKNRMLDQFQTFITSELGLFTKVLEVIDTDIGHGATARIYPNFKEYLDSEAEHPTPEKEG